MTCQDVRRALIERPSGPQPDLREHLEGCAECRALMEEIRMGDEALGGWIAAFEQAGSFDAAWKKATAVPAAPAPRGVRTWALAAAALLVAGASFGAGWGASRIAGWSAIGTSEGWSGPPSDLAVAQVEPDEDGETAVEVRLAVPEPEPGPVAAVPALTIVPGFDPAWQPAPRPRPVPPQAGTTLQIIRGTPESSRPVPGATPVSAAIEATTGVEPQPYVDPSCSDLRDLEPAAMLGKLNPGQVGCLEARFLAEGGTTRDKVSRVLMANAWASGDTAGWERIVVRHLDQVDPLDPDLDYKYALFLSKKGGRSEEVIRWAGMAMYQRDQEKGDHYVTRFYALYKLRAAAAQDLWKRAVEAHAAAPSPDGEAAVADAQARTRVFAQEWYEFAVEHRQDKAVAADLCTAAGGTCAE